MTDAQLLARIEVLITYGNNSTSAQNFRDILTDLVNNKWSNNGNVLAMASGGVITIGGNQVIKGIEPDITNAVTEHSFSGTYDAHQIEGACNALGNKINSILTALRNHGLITDL